MRPRALGIAAIALASILLVAPTASGWTQLAPITPDAPNAMIYTKGLALDLRGGSSSIWVTDVGKGAPNDRAYRYPLVPTGTSTQPLQSIGGTFTGGGTMNYPGGIAVNQANGDVYIADTNNNRILRFSATGILLDYSGPNFNGTIPLDRPHGLKIAGDTLYIANSGTNGAHRAIKRVSLDLDSWGADITSADFHTGPSDIAVDPEHNRIWAADEGYRAGETDPGVTTSTLGSVLAFNLSTGAQIARYTRGPAGANPFGQPYSVEYDADANLLYMSDYAKNAIFVLNADSGDFVDKIQTPSPLSPNTPVAMSFDPASRILYVGQVGTKTFNGTGAREIERFQLDPAPPKPLPPAPPDDSAGATATAQGFELPAIKLTAHPALKQLRVRARGKSLIDIKGTIAFAATSCAGEAELSLRSTKGHRSRTLNSSFVKLHAAAGNCSGRFTITASARARKQKLSLILTHPGNDSILPIDADFQLPRS